MTSAARFTGLVAFLFLAAACGPAAESTPPAREDSPTAVVIQPPSAEWNAFLTQYSDDYLAAHPAFAAVQGRHEYDGMLPDWSAGGIALEIARLKKVRANALAFDRAALGDEGPFQREYLVASIDRSLFWLDSAEWPFVNPAFYFDPTSDSLDPGPYIRPDYAPLEARMESFIRYAGQIPGAARQIRANLRMPMDRTRLQFGIDAFGGLADYFRNDVPAVFTAVDDEGLQAQLAQAGGAAATAMQELAEWLRNNLETATEQYALGPELFRQMIYDTERVGLTLEELEAMGRADLRRNQIALGEACAEFAPGQSIRSCFALLAQRNPSSPADERAGLPTEQARAFRSIFASPACTEGWAHYAEQMAHDAGLQNASAENRIKQLGNALLRNTRLLSAIGLHTRGMTVEEAQKLFSEEAYLDQGTALRQAARGTWDPTYLNDTLGKLMIAQLRAEWTSVREGRKSWKEFHDTFLSYGGLPIPLVREQMLGVTAP